MDHSMNLLREVRDGKLEEVRNIITKYGISHRPEWCNGYNLLLAALEHGKLEVAQFLLGSGCNVNSSTRNSNDKTPLEVALKQLPFLSAEPKVEDGPHVRRQNDNTLLHCAALGYESIVKILLDKGADVNVTDSFGNTPLHLAVERAAVDITVLLVEHGANVNARKSREMPLHVALQRGHNRIAEYLVKHGADVDMVGSDNGYKGLHYFVEKEYDGIVGILLSASVNSRQNGRTPLHLAAERGQAIITKNLLNHGSDVNSMCTEKPKGFSPLHFAVRNGHESVARILLECGANINAQDETGVTILEVAVFGENPTIVKMVLDNRPDVNNESNRSTLNFALNGSSSEYEEIVELLLENGFNIRDEADVNAVSEMSKFRKCKSSIHAAALNGYVTVLEALLERGASANSRDEKGQTPLHEAAKKGNQQVIDTLVRNGADIDSRDKDGNTPLHFALCMVNQNALEGLLDYNPVINITNSNKRTACDYSENSSRKSFRKAYLSDSEDDLVTWRDNYDDKNIDYNPFYYLHEILEHHIIKLKTANLSVSHKNLRSIKYNQKMQDFEDECKNEFQTLRQTFVGNTKHSFHRLLTKNDHHLAIILKDDNVSRCIKPDEIKEKFPLYGSIICGRMTIAKHRRKILDEASACVFQKFPRLNWDCIQNIIAYLSNGDLMNVIHACKRMPAAL